MNKVLYIVEDKDCAQYRYRVQNVTEALDNGNCDIAVLEKSNINRISLEKVSVIVILRQVAKDRDILKLIKDAQNSGIKV